MPCQLTRLFRAVGSQLRLIEWCHLHVLLVPLFHASSWFPNDTEVTEIARYSKRKKQYPVPMARMETGRGIDVWVIELEYLAWNGNYHI